MIRPVPPSDRAYWRRVKAVAQVLHSDGCSGVPDFYLDVCWEHDIHYRTHQTVEGQALTRRNADALLRAGIQARSSFGRFSPMAWWRWAALRWMGEAAWEHETAGSPMADPTRPEAP